MATYNELSNLLQGRCANERKLGNNTVARRLYNNDIAIKLHSTNVLVFHTNGDITLDSGGWHTVTTKDRLNAYLPYGWQVWQEKFSWYLSHTTFETDQTPRVEHGKWDFQDGMTIVPETEEVLEPGIVRVG